MNCQVIKDCDSKEYPVQCMSCGKYFCSHHGYDSTDVNDEGTGFIGEMLCNFCWFEKDEDMGINEMLQFITDLIDEYGTFKYGTDQTMTELNDRITAALDGFLVARKK